MSTYNRKIKKVLYYRQMIRDYTPEEIVAVIDFYKLPLRDRYNKRLREVIDCKCSGIGTCYLCKIERLYSLYANPAYIEKADREEEKTMIRKRRTIKYDNR